MTRYVFTRNPDGTYRVATLAGRVLGTLARVRMSNRVPAEVRWQAVDRNGRRVGPPQMSRDRAAELLDAQRQARDTIYGEGRCARLVAGEWRLYERVAVTEEGHGLYERAGTAGSEAEARAWAALLPFARTSHRAQDLGLIADEEDRHD